MELGCVQIPALCTKKTSYANWRCSRLTDKPFIKHLIAHLRKTICQLKLYISEYNWSKTKTKWR